MNLSKPRRRGKPSEETGVTRAPISLAKTQCCCFMAMSALGPSGWNFLLPGFHLSGLSLVISCTFTVVFLLSLRTADFSVQRFRI